MFVNKLNQLYKPDRILFYTDATDDEIQDFYRGSIPDALKRYENAFGTYDVPGVFYVKDLPQKVIGIEYRCDDPRIDYPDD